MPIAYGNEINWPYTRFLYATNSNQDLVETGYPNCLTYISTTIAGFQECTASKVGDGWLNSQGRNASWNLDWSATTSDLTDINDVYPWILRRRNSVSSSSSTIVADTNHLVDFMADNTNTYGEKLREARLHFWQEPKPTIDYDIIHTMYYDLPTYSFFGDTSCQGFVYDDVYTTSHTATVHFPKNEFLETPGLLNYNGMNNLSSVILTYPSGCKPLTSQYAGFYTPFRLPANTNTIPPNAMQRTSITGTVASESIGALQCDVQTDAVLQYSAIPLVDDPCFHTSSISKDDYLLSQSYSSFTLSQNKNYASLAPIEPE